MSNVLISLIIPIYKVEPYLRRCLNCCVNQDLPARNYEIIAVNDGSPDNCIEILREYEKVCSNLIVIDKPNGGLSSARNTGLDVAQGDLIWFVDGDDNIREHCLKEICEFFIQTDIEVMTFNHRFMDDYDNLLPKKERTTLSDQGLYTGDYLFSHAYVYPYSGVQFYIYKHSFLLREKLRFKEGIYFEDLLFTGLCYTHMNRCMFINKEYYDYYRHGGSITNSPASLKKGQDNITVADILYKELGKYGSVKDKMLSSMVAIMVKPIYIQWARLDNDKERKELRKMFLKCFVMWLLSISRSGRWKYLILIMQMIFGIRLLWR